MAQGTTVMVLDRPSRDWLLVSQDNNVGLIPTAIVGALHVCVSAAVLILGAESFVRAPKALAPVGGAAALCGVAECPHPQLQVLAEALARNERCRASPVQKTKTCTQGCIMDDNICCKCDMAITSHETGLYAVGRC